MIMFTLMETIHIYTLRPAPCAIGSYTCETPSNLQYAVLYMTLTLASLGLGGTRFTIASMGAQQLDKNKDQATFVDWYYLTLYVANIISFTAIIYIQDSVSWGLGFALCALVNAIGLASLVLGKRLYRQVKPKGSPFMSIARVLVAAIRKRKASGGFGCRDYYYSGATQMLKMEDSSSTKRFRFLNRAALKTESDKQSDGSYARSWRLCPMEEVEVLKSLLKIIPVWSAGLPLCTSVGTLVASQYSKP
ncbi:protein NRT1/ PTR FAMILY 2.3-like [Carya illinoinensis]|uniref:protein NRT1/ PTR FAMILY 2.3-like n=1 Tax=Carya illinoinensis TaxID=32201 RepID=UPI001C71EE4B|nr:protein NRT1/ PTR FAMILY 2.3-like [Carya illinoinensis]